MNKKQHLGKIDELQEELSNDSELSELEEDNDEEDYKKDARRYYLKKANELTLKQLREFYADARLDDDNQQEKSKAIKKEHMKYEELLNKASDRIKELHKYIAELTTRDNDKPNNELEKIQNELEKIQNELDKLHSWTTETGNTEEETDIMHWDKVQPSTSFRKRKNTPLSDSALKRANPQKDVSTKTDLPKTYSHKTINNQEKQRPPPPITIKNKEQWKQISALLKQAKINYVKAKLQPDGIKINPETPDDYRNLRKLLLEKKMEHYTYRLPEEKANKKSDRAAQCYRCQGYNHTQTHCTMAVRCVKCGGNHQATDCQKKTEEPAKCANCRGTHTPNFLGCPMAPRKIPLKEIRQGVSYSQVTRDPETPQNLEAPNMLQMLQQLKQFQDMMSQMAKFFSQVMPVSQK